MTKVKLIHSGWLSAPNGANTVMNSLLYNRLQFANYGIEMTSLTPDSYSPRSFDKVSQSSFKAVWRARLKRWLKNSTQLSRLACDLMIYIVELLPGKKISQIYIDSNPDEDEVAFFHTVAPCYYFLKNRKKKQHTVIVLHTNGENYKMEKLYYPKLQSSLIFKKMLYMEKYVIEHVDRINFVSSMSKDNFLHLHPEISPNKVFYIYNGVEDTINAERSRRDDGIMEFCCVASLSKRKGQHYIVEALKMFEHNELLLVHFTFVGEGSDREMLEHEVDAAGLSKYITFAGITQKVDEYLVNSDIFILPSEDEGLPMAIIEAMRASLPIVSTPVGGIPEMINDGVNGLLIQPSSQDIYDVLSHIDKYNWKEMGINARKTFQEKFTLNRMTEGYAKLLSF